LATCQEVP